MRIYENLGFSPQNVMSTTSARGATGICHDDDYWYVVQGCSIQKIPAHSINQWINYNSKEQSVNTYSRFFPNRRFFKYYKPGDTSTPMGVALSSINEADSTDSFGDIDCFNGYLFVPVCEISKGQTVGTRIVVFSTLTFDCVCSEVLYKKDSTPFKKMPWCAVNPLDKCLYTSDAYISDSFEGPSSPVMAFKINFNNLRNKSGTVFSCVDGKGVKLKRYVSVDSDSTVPYVLDAEVQGGCFDPFDTLYLSTNSLQEVYIRNKAYYLWLEKGRPLQSEDAKRKDWLDANAQIDSDLRKGKRECEGITAFVLERENSTSNEEYIRQTAYYIWKTKGSPIQSIENSKKDWLNAKTKVNADFFSGSAKSIEKACAGLACVKVSGSKYTDKSIIDFSFDERCAEEPAGVTYWDLRRYSKDGEKGRSWRDGCLHALKITKATSYPPIGKFSLQNFVLKNLETSSVILNYDPARLKVEYNSTCREYFVMSNSVPIKGFATQEIAKNAMLVMENFKTIVMIGRCVSSDDQYDLSYDLLYNPVSDSTNINGVKCEKVHFNSFYIDDMRNVVENKWKSDYELVLELSNYDDFKESYQRIAFPVHDILTASLIEGVIMNYSNYTKKKNGFLNYVKLSNCRKDTLYWFD